MIKIITVHYNEKIQGFNDEEINKFCINKVVKSMKYKFVNELELKYWTVFIEYEELGGVIEKTEVNLSDADKIFLEKLKIWRKETAKKEGLPVFRIANNKQFEDIINNKPKTLEALKNINGFGKKKVEKYGKDIVEIVKSFYGDEKNE